MKKSEKLLIVLVDQKIIAVDDIVSVYNMLTKKEEVKKEEKDSKAVEILDALGFNTYKPAPKKEEVKPEPEKSSFTKFLQNLVSENYKPKTENGTAIYLKIVDLVKVKESYKKDMKDFNQKLYQLGAALALFEFDLFDEIEKKVYKSYLVKSQMDNLAKSLKTEVK